MKAEVRRLAARRLERRQKQAAPRAIPPLNRKAVPAPTKKTRNPSWEKSNRPYAPWTKNQSTWWILK